MRCVRKQSRAADGSPVGHSLLTTALGRRKSVSCISRQHFRAGITTSGLIHGEGKIFSLLRVQTSFGAHPVINPLNAKLNPICYLLALLGAHHFLHVSRIRVKSLTLRLLMSYIYIYSTYS
jgi:hypothetical protein